MLFEAFIEQGDTSPKGGVPERQMGRAVNPLTSVFESSDLSPSTIQYKFKQYWSDILGCVCSSMVER